MLNLVGCKNARTRQTEIRLRHVHSDDAREIMPDFTRQYWLGMHHETDWKPGSSWRMLFRRWPGRRRRRNRRGRSAEAPGYQVAQRVQTGTEIRGLFALRNRDRGDRRRRQTDRNPRHGSRRVKIHRGCVRRLAAHSLKSQVSARDGRCRPERPSLAAQDAETEIQIKARGES